MSDDVCSLRDYQRYSSMVSAATSTIHLLNEGPFSVLFASSVVYNAVSQFSYHSAIRSIRKRRPIYNFSLTILALLRVAFISLRDESTIALFFAYLSLFVAFTENLSMLSSAKYLEATYDLNVRRQRRRLYDQNPYAAPAA
ncbi:unnamed protein product [Caenorhabditis auriculariae]|uniref:Uncharacterized protein n=1 Tax=Caenorhabditis auriculariae TaxID=2777116 RepID=A0A8S1HZ17_9PELO|nr:unnamed protein product [Caenorhabditis auriculariae]